MKYNTLKIIAALSLLATTGCLTGIEGDSNVLNSKFAGISSVTITSPTSARLNWTATESFVNYRIYVSTSEAPIGSTVFDNYVVSGLTPNKNYGFSVSGIRADGSEEGLNIQLSAKTWSHLTGPTSATALNHSTVRLNWSYNSGPAFKVYKNIGAPPTAEQLAGTPVTTTQDNTGAVITGLSSNTDYYFAVVANYSSGGTSIDHLQLSASTKSVDYSYTELLSHPTVTAPALVITGTYPQFTITGSNPLFSTGIYNGDIQPANLIALLTGNGTVQSSVILPDGSHDLSVKITDTIGGGVAYGSLRGISVAANPLAALQTVHVVTPTSINPLPRITGATINFGPYPVFTVEGAELDYETTISYQGQVIGILRGNGELNVLPSNPLPQGNVRIYPRVTKLSEYADLPPMDIHIKNVDNLPYTAPSSINGTNPSSGGAGTSAATGDFNCDGISDLAVGVPYGSFNTPINGSSQFLDGGVVVYYGTATGLDLSAEPSRTPTGTKPLIIPAPVRTSNGSSINFGVAVAAGNINGDNVSGKACQDLVVGAPYRQVLPHVAGAIYVYYGSPTGLQVSHTTMTTNTFGCSIPDFYMCYSSEYYMTGNTYGDYTYHPASSYGMAHTIAVGDFNGDGYDEVAAGRLHDTDWPNNKQSQGAVYLFQGTSSGLSPNFVKMTLPTANVQSWATMGIGIAFGYVYDNAHTAKDLIITAPGYFNGSGRGALVVVKANPALAFSDYVDATGHLITHTSIKLPKACSTANDYCGYAVAAADVNGDNFDDVIMGNPISDYASKTDNGNVLIYYGSVAGLVDPTPAVQPTANAAGCTADNSYASCAAQLIYRSDGDNNWFFGTSINVLGDTNGDGYVDIGIGAQRANPLKNGADSRNGVGYIYYGGPRGLIPAPAATIDISSPKNALFGTQIVGGKFRSGYGGAAYQDIVVTAPGETLTLGTGLNTNYGPGVLHFFYNDGSGFPSTINATHQSASTEVRVAGLAGQAMEHAKIVGDINGDGYADVAAPFKLPGATGPRIGAWPAIAGAQVYGIVIYYGGPTGLVTDVEPMLAPVPGKPLILTPHGFDYAVSSHFGLNVIPCGDVNGDGFSDVCGATGTAANGLAGTLYLFYGTASGLVASPAPSLTPAAALDPVIVSNQRAGIYYSNGTPYPQFVTSGDFNGDGYSDMLLTNMDNPAAHTVPHNMIIYGSRSGFVTAGSIYAPTDAAYATTATDNKAVMTPTCYVDSQDEKRCRPLIICRATGLGAYCTGATQIMSGNSVVNLGDVDGDGSDDLGLHTELSMNFTDADGHITIFYGNTDYGISPANQVKLLISPQFVPLPTRYPSGRHINSISSAGDINGDGIGDIIFGGYTETISSWPTVAKPNPYKYQRTGAAYIVYGINGGYKILGTSVCASYPCTVTITNAVNNTPNGNPLNVVHQSDISCTGTGCNVLRFYANGYLGTDRYFGSRVLGLGDMTGDGLSEVAVLTNTAVTPQRIFIFSGSESGLQVSTNPLTTPDCRGSTCTPYMLIPPNPTSAAWKGATNMGYIISPWARTGDVDGDGSNDFLITTPTFNNPDGLGFWTGGFFLFH